MKIPEEYRPFLEAKRLAVVAVQRPGRPPALTPVYYVVDGDDLLVSTTKRRFKGRVVPESPDVVLCVLGEEFPFPYLTVHGKGRIEEEGAAPLMARIGEVMFQRTFGEDMMPAIEQRAAEEQRVVLRVTPERFTGDPFR